MRLVRYGWDCSLAFFVCVMTSGIDAASIKIELDMIALVMSHGLVTETVIFPCYFDNVLFASSSCTLAVQVLVRCISCKACPHI